MKTRRAAMIALLSAWLYLPTAPARAESVDLELLLAVDVSPSINRGEYILQMRGLAEALRAPEVVAALESLAPGGVARRPHEADWSRISSARQPRGSAAGGGT